MHLVWGVCRLLLFSSTSLKKKCQTGCFCWFCLLLVIGRWSHSVSVGRETNRLCCPKVGDNKRTNCTNRSDGYPLPIRSLCPWNKRQQKNENADLAITNLLGQLVQQLANGIWVVADHLHAAIFYWLIKRLPASIDRVVTSMGGRSC